MTATSTLSAGELKVREVIQLAAQATSLAEKARKSKHGLTGDGDYARKFHQLGIALTVLLQELPTILSRAIGAADIERFVSELRAVVSSSTEGKERSQLLRSLRTLGEATILPAIAKEDRPTEPTTHAVLPLSVVQPSRGYIVSVTLQANGCYENGWHDAASVMVRKLIELLIIEVYEAKGRASDIQNAAGDFMMLGDLVDRVVGDRGWNLGRETKAVLPKIKALGDRSAHNRRFMAKRPDVDAIIPGLRVAVDDLLHLSGLK